MRPPTYIGLSLTFLSCASIAFSQCTLNVPQNPLTAQGLATPYTLTGCNQLDFANEGVFVEAAIIDPVTGQIQIYNPLVINAGMTAVGTSSSSSSGGSSSNSGSSSKSSSSSASTTSSSVPLKTTSTSTSTTLSSKISSSSSSVKANTGNTSTIASTRTTSAGATLTQVARAAATTGAGFFIPPIVPTLPTNAVVALWFGSNANTVTLTGDIATCVNGLGTSVFGQFAYCNAPAWFNAAITTVQNGMTKIPAPGTGSGQACPTIRDFRIVDQDQSDNVVTTYLLVGGNTLAQNTPANSQANPNAEVLSNASDNALINEFIQPALGCTSYSNTCTTCPKGSSPALATNELQASFFPPAGGPAMVPLNDPMVLVNGQQSLQKVNLYRSGVNQAQADNANASGTTYCQQFAQSGLFISLNQQLFTGTTSPAADQATNLFTFLAMRFSASFGPAPGLGCMQLLNAANPVTLTTDGNGVVTAATINTQELQQILTGTTTTSTAATTSATQSGVRLVSSVSGATTATPTVTASNTTSATLSSVRTSSAAGTTTLAKSSSASLTSVRTSSAAGTTTLAKSSSASLTSVRTSSAAGTTTLAKSSSVSLTSVRTSSAAGTTTLAKSSSASLTSVRMSSTAVTATTAATSATHSSSQSVSTSSRTATTASPTTTSRATTTGVVVTSHTTVATGVTSSGVCTLTVTVTATVCPSPTSQASHNYRGQGEHHWARGIQAREHSRMQKKNRHSSNW